jgi:hypothetical protein
MTDPTPDDPRLVLPPYLGEGLDTQRMREQMGRRLFGAELDPLKVGRFVVVDRLGQGGMGTVFRGYDPDLDRDLGAWAATLPPPGPRRYRAALDVLDRKSVV